MTSNLAGFTDVLGEADEIDDSQPISLSSPLDAHEPALQINKNSTLQPKRCSDIVEPFERHERPKKHAGQHGDFRSVEEIDTKYRSVFSYPYFNLVQSGVIEDALYSDKSMVVCAPTGSGKTVVFEMAIVQLLMALEDRNYTGDFKIIYMAPVKALCSERLAEWYPKFTRLGLLCIEVTGDTDVDFSQLKPYRIIVTTPEKWDMLTRRWRDHNRLVGTIKLFLIDEVHILNDQTRGPVLEAVVSRMKTIEASSQSAHRIEQLQKHYNRSPHDQPLESQVSVYQQETQAECPRIRFVAVSATVSNPEDVAAWLGTDQRPAVYYKFGDECRPVKLRRVVEGYPCPTGCTTFKFDIILNYKLWPIIHKYYDGKPTLIFCNTRKSVTLTAETLSKEITVSFSPEQRAKLAALAATIKNKKLQSLVLSGVGCHHAGLLFEERMNIETAFRNRDLPILITTTTLAMGVNLPAHLVIIKNTQQYVNGQYQEYSISTVLQMVGRAGRPQFDSEATAVIMTTAKDKARYQALVEGDEPLQSYLHKRLAENLNSEAALGTVTDVAQCVQWLRSTFLSVRAAKDPRRYLGLPQAAPAHLITKKLEELCVCAMNGLASAGLITMDEASCIASTEAGRLMSVHYVDLETMKHFMKINGKETLEQLVWLLCESHELADMHLRVDERRCLNALNRNNSATTIRYPMKGKINTRQMKLNCVIQAVLGCLPIAEPSLHQEAAKVMRVADRLCKCLVAYVTRSEIVTSHPQYYSAVVNSLVLAKCVHAQLWDNSPYVSRQLKGIGPTFSALLASAGKTSFMLLEESHPRDLERIMNKGPPAGNILRKQVGLLPRYQLTATPRDHASVTVQLLLLNQAHLSENMDSLTAGDSHRCHIVVGDSENHLLLLTSFKDKDLISLYDGTITYEVARIHDFEHKVFAHCVSSTFVGIDVQCEYTFKDLAPSFSRGTLAYSTQEPNKKTTQKQASITDTFKERKRRTNETDITQSKEKKKRNTALMDKFNNLKESFGITTKEIKDDLHKASEMAEQILNERFVPNAPSKQRSSHDPRFINEADLYWAVDESIMEPSSSEVSHVTAEQDHNTLMAQYHADTDIDYPEMILESNEDESFTVDSHVDEILNEIENEIYKSRDSAKRNPMTGNDFRTENTNNNNMSSDYEFAIPKESQNRCRQPRETQSLSSKVGSDVISKLNDTKQTRQHLQEIKKRKPTNTRSNFNFIETIEKKMNSVENEETVPVKESGFTEAIKREIEKFINTTKSNTKPNDNVFQELVGDENNREDLETNRREDDIVDLTVEEIPVSLVNNIPKKSLKPSEIDLTELDLIENIPVSLVNNRPKKSQKPNEIDLSELPEVCIDDDHKIKRKSIIETTKWLETENPESVEKIDLDGHLMDLFYPDSERTVKGTNDRPNNDDGNYLTSTKLKEPHNNASTNLRVNSNPRNYSDEIELYNNDLDTHNLIYNSNRNLKIPSIETEKTENTDVVNKFAKIGKAVEIEKTRTDSLRKSRSSDENYEPRNGYSGSCLLPNNGKRGIDVHSLIAIHDHNRMKYLTESKNCIAEIENTDIMKLTVKNDDINTYRNRDETYMNNKETGIISHDNITKPYTDSCTPSYSNDINLRVENNELGSRENNDSRFLDIHSIIAIHDKYKNSLEPNFNRYDNNTWNLEDNSPVSNRALACLTESRSNDENCTRSNNSVVQNLSINPYKALLTPHLMTTVPKDGTRKKVETSKEQYVNKYHSFSATNTNVCRKNTPEHEVTIIKKLKVNLDVTEIISRARSKDQKNYNDNTVIERLEVPCTRQENSCLYNGHNAIFDQNQSRKGDVLNSNGSTIPMLMECPINMKTTEINTTKDIKSTHTNELESIEKPTAEYNEPTQTNRSTVIVDVSTEYPKRKKESVANGEGDVLNSNGSTIPMLMENPINMKTMEITTTKYIKSTHTNNLESIEKPTAEYYKSTHINDSTAKVDTITEDPTQTNESNARNIDELKDIKEKHDHKIVTKNMVNEPNSNQDSTASGHIHNKLQNILDKYMKIMGKNAVDINSEMDINKTRNEPNIKTSQAKPTRPFKISEISKIDMSLPKSTKLDVITSQTPKITKTSTFEAINIQTRSPRLTNENALYKVTATESKGQLNDHIVKASIGNLKRHTMHIYKDVIKGYASDVKQHNIPRLGLQSKHFSEIDSHENVTTEYKDIKEYDMPKVLNENDTENVTENFEIHDDSQTPTHNKSCEKLQDDFEIAFDSQHLGEKSMDYNIGQDMLDPRSLLRRFAKGDECEMEEIIPPPAEFCDNDINAYSPTPNNDLQEYTNDGLHSADSKLSYDENYENIQEDIDTAHDRSIFEENAHNTLTPSKEIETWTFEDELNETRPRKIFPQFPQCVTVLRSNANAGVKEGGLTSRQHKLKKFRVPRKDKLKL